MAGEQYSQGQMDALARQQGFKNYEQWAAWNRNTRQVVMQGNPATGQAPKNWLQRLLERIPGHPTQTLGYTNKRMGEALGDK